MNKTFCKKSNYNNFFLAGCLILFNLILVFTGCGLDTFYVIEAPNVRFEPSYNNFSQDQQYFEFWTNEEWTKYNGDGEGFRFLGTEVYYKIYNKASTEYSSIVSAASNETTANQSATRLMDTYKFQPLRCSNNIGANILIPTAEEKEDRKNRLIRIQLSDYPEYPSEFTIDNNTIGVPVRSIPKTKLATFNFKEHKYNDIDYLPESGDNIDADYGYSSTSEEITDYYVYMFAVSVATDVTYSQLYSTAVYLGSVKISVVD